MIAVTVGLVAVTTLGVLRLGAAVDESGQAQTAADAAALGGATDIRDGLVETLAGAAVARGLRRPLHLRQRAATARSSSPRATARRSRRTATTRSRTGSR